MCRRRWKSIGSTSPRPREVRCVYIDNIIKPATLSNFDQRVDIHAAPWAGTKKPHMEHQRLMLRITARAVPLLLSTSRVKIGGVGAPQAPFGGDLLGNRDPPLSFEGRSFFTKTTARIDC